MSGSAVATTVADLVAAARARVQNLTVDDFAAHVELPDTGIVDVREPGELTGGVIRGALAVPRGRLEFHTDPARPYHLSTLQTQRRIRLYCKSGGRSVLAAATLLVMGYADVAHLDGGVLAWTAAGRTLQPPRGD